MEDPTSNRKGNRIKWGVFLFAPLLFLILVFGVDLEPGRPEITYTLAVALLMALWWITEIVPLAMGRFRLMGWFRSATRSATSFQQ